jgi:hypothetical protein
MLAVAVAEVVFVVVLVEWDSGEASRLFVRLYEGWRGIARGARVTSAQRLQWACLCAW